MPRRRFLGVALTGLGALAVGSQARRVADLTGGTAAAAPAVVELTIGEALVEMVDLTTVYAWTFGDAEGPRFPGPVITAVEGDQVTVRVANTLDEAHAFAVLDTGITTGPIAPGATAEITFTAPPAGTYLYLDPLNAPVNRVLGLHGMMVVLPADPATPYTSPPPKVRQLFSDLGTTPQFPGEGWVPARTTCWLIHSIDPRWPARAQAGLPIDPTAMATDFRALYFTLNGQAGFFAAHDPANTPTGRIGQPHLVRIANAGMVVNSLHNHGNHVFLLARDNLTGPGAPFIDSCPVAPLERVDWLLPFTRPVDIPGPATRPLSQALAEELAYVDSYGLAQSPLEFPMHCHMEPSQTAHGGLYPGGLVTHWVITGDLAGPPFPAAAESFSCAPTIDHTAH